MMAVHVTDVPKQPSWTSYIVGLKVSEEFTADYSKRSTISPLISGVVAYKYPKRKFKTRKENLDGKDYLIVRRIK